MRTAGVSATRRAADLAPEADRYVVSISVGSVDGLLRLSRPLLKAEQRVRFGYHPHPTRQDRTQLLQSVAFTPGTGEIQVKIKKAAGAIAATAAMFGLGAVPIAWGTGDFG
jgi:hypothetical protein